MTSLLVSVILAVCPGYDEDGKGQVITDSCQEYITNCSVNIKGQITEESIRQCVEKYRDEQEQLSRGFKSK